MMDYRQYEITGATAISRDAFELALGAFLSWRGDAQSHLDRALLESPNFTMAHVLSAYMSVWSRDVNRVRQARAAQARISSESATTRELLHHAAIGAALREDLEMLRILLDELLERYPRDVLALHAGHALDYLTGDLERMARRVPSVLAAWSADMPGFHSVLAMQAFVAVECASYGPAVDAGRRALELDPWDARAHHALAHLHEMTGDAAAGIVWMLERAPFWSENTVAGTHCWWHCALFHLALGEYGAALELYDRRVRAARSAEIADLIDASALLWRVELHGRDTGSRWLELAHAWQHHLADGYCSFNDLHAMLAFVGAEDWRSAKRLEAQLVRSCALATRYGETTRLVGLPACRGAIAFGRADYARATEFLTVIPAVALRLGGSHAQRDVMSMTLLEAARRSRGRRLRKAAA
jgi:tetratricopeptide (TPR) repeat protein